MLTDSVEAVGAVTQLLQTQLSTAAVPVLVGRPEQAAVGTGPKLNLFLYQVEFDGHLRNLPLDQGQPAPLWMVLSYLLTAYDESSESDSVQAHRHLGRGLARLQDLNFLRPDPINPAFAALVDNPEPLKITFGSADVELLSKIMQGTDERYRVSGAFEVRPILVMPGSDPSYSLPVQSVGPPTDPGVLVIPSLGPVLDSLSPDTIEPLQDASGDEVVLTLNGQDLGSAQEVTIGGESFPIVAAPAGSVLIEIPQAAPLSADAHPTAVVQELPNGRRITSNPLMLKILPTLASAVPGATAPDPNGDISGLLNLTGRRLGGPDDEIFVAFYRDGQVAAMVQGQGAEPQTALAITLEPEQAIPPGFYRIILRVNSQQALVAPEVEWV